MGAKIDIARGLPIIHLNLIGYDEVAHNRGPSSKAASWSLKGIDHAIAKIYRDALHAQRRSYDVWIYSDHGQEDSISYAMKYKKNIQEAVAEVLKGFDASFDLLHIDKNEERLQRVSFLGFSFAKKYTASARANQGNSAAKKLIVTALGPKGDIYLPRKMAMEEMHRFSRELVDKAKIPVVMQPEKQGNVRVWTVEGEFTLPKDAKKILGENRPNLAQVTEDLINLCHHANAGDLIIMGFKPGHKTITFPVEHGAHGGPGLEETNGFTLLPIDVVPRKREQTYLTPTDLRYAALRFLKRPIVNNLKQYYETSIPEKIKAVPGKVRIMTYNVHSCIGTDGKISPERIARAIGRHEPDIVALQELDTGRERTGEADQPHLIARELDMACHFHPAVVIGQEQYGIAVLSRYPLKLIRAGLLPLNAKNPLSEPRGVIWSVIDIAGTKINLFNTHLGLFPGERLLQAKALLGPEWLGHPERLGPVIMCGDFNAFPFTKVYRNFKGVLRDAQKELDDHSPKATFFSRYPVARIDHVFVSPEFEVFHAEVSRTDLDKIASDHLPLIVDLRIKN
jgi:endonuclease/exonuclease/phosphatase family metal-dependent hydrolase